MTGPLGHLGRYLSRMLFDQYENEAAFRSRFVRPLLTRLGFVAIAELHGTQEFGKDFVFSELTPFGSIRHYAAVVKHEKAIRQSSVVLCQTVLAQIRQAFSVTFQLPDSDAVNRVSSVVVFNSGSITENARTWLRSELNEEKYGRNCHIFDGERLHQLDLNATFRRGEQFLPRLQGLQTDLALNLRVWESLSESLPEFSEGRGSFTTALQDFVASPFLTDRINLTEVITLIQECRIVDTITQRYILFGPKTDKREQDVASLKNILQKCTKRAQLLMAQIKSVSTAFQPLSNDIER